MIEIKELGCVRLLAPAMDRWRNLAFVTFPAGVETVDVTH